VVTISATVTALPPGQRHWDRRAGSDVRGQRELDRLGQRHVPLLATLGRAEGQLTADVADLPPDVHDRTTGAQPVDVIGGQAEHLTLPQPELHTPRSTGTR
jgi:hypothetical protein